MVGYIIKIENLTTSSGEKTDMLIGFSVVDSATNALQILNLSNIWPFLVLKISFSLDFVKGGLLFNFQDQKQPNIAQIQYLKNACSQVDYAESDERISFFVRPKKLEDSQF